MKKGFLFLLFLGILMSCSENVQFNNDPTIQGLKDNVAWEAYTSTAVASETRVTLVGIGDNQSVTLKMDLPDDYITQTDELTYVSYELGTNFTNQAIYTTVVNGVDYLYQTGTNVGDGEIVITNYDGVTISGTFRFNAVNEDPDSEEAEIVNFNKGVFYKIPITAN
jgi:hypothetical protein